MTWGIGGWILMITFCLVLVAFIVNTVSLTIETYKKIVAGDYGKGDWTMMGLTVIPIALSAIASYGLYHLLIKNPFWLA